MHPLQRVPKRLPRVLVREVRFRQSRFGDRQAKANDTEFEEQMFHIIRAFHVAGAVSGTAANACASVRSISLCIF